MTQKGWAFKDMVLHLEPPVVLDESYPGKYLGTNHSSQREQLKQRPKSGGMFTKQKETIQCLKGRGLTGNEVEEVGGDQITRNSVANSLHSF